MSRPRLLASVRDREEASTALRGGADVLDLKDPSRGSLGPCAPALLRDAVGERDAIARGTASRARVPVSAALGDAIGAPGTRALAEELAAAGADYLKVGLHGTGSSEAATRALRDIVHAVRGSGGSTHVIAALFADDDPGLSPPLSALPGIVLEAGASGCLIDTLGKSGATIFECAGSASLTGFLEACRRLRLLSALAGSIGRAQLARVRALGPDLVGARGALCRGGRSGPLDADRLRDFRFALCGP
jgi:(5-formylfuran-3-yl)methyl phosphate synthase